MVPQVLILGGQGRIGSSIARDLVQHTGAQVVVTRRRRSVPDVPDTLDLPTTTNRVTAKSLDLADQMALDQAIAQADLVIHCAGPFHHRDGRVLKACIQRGVSYLDVSDCVPFTRRALALHEAAKRAEVTAIVNTGVFPGVSNSMARQCVEAFNAVDDQPADLFLGYVVGGSGGAGVTVMRTTFLGLLRPFKAWVDGQWQERWPYRDRQVIDFPKPFGPTGVYWFEVPETCTLVDSLPVQTVVTKFGSAPDLYNRLTHLVARWCPPTLLQRPAAVEFLSQVSYRMTQVTDRWSGTGIGIWAEAIGQSGRRYRSVLLHDDAAIAAGVGTGSLAQLVLSGELAQPGVNPVERALPTCLFRRITQSRGLHLTHGWVDR
ncbi:MAG: saccharopine dehydrogenase NADP-binding domain-containing protein [Elainellaceae cyanobacterium]